MYKNIAKSVTATEATPNNLTQITNIDGRVPHRQPRSRSEPSSSSSGQKGHKIDSFQDPLSRPSYQNGQREHKTSSFQDPFLSTQLIWLVCMKWVPFKTFFQDPKQRMSELIIWLDQDDMKAKVHFKTFFQDTCIWTGHSIMRKV